MDHGMGNPQIRSLFLGFQAFCRCQTWLFTSLATSFSPDKVCGWSCLSERSLQDKVTLALWYQMFWQEGAIYKLHQYHLSSRYHGAAPTTCLEFKAGVSYPVNTWKMYEKIAYVKIDHLDQILTYSIKKQPDVCPSHNQNSGLFCHKMGMSQALWQDVQAVFVHMVQCPQTLRLCAWMDVHSPYVELLAAYANRQFGGMDESIVKQSKRPWRAFRKQNDEDQAEGCLNNYSGLQLTPRYIREAV